MRGCADHGHHHLVRGVSAGLHTAEDGEPAPGLGREAGLRHTGHLAAGAEQDGAGADGAGPVTRVLVSHVSDLGLHVCGDPTRGGLHYLADLLVQVVQVLGVDGAQEPLARAEDVREGGEGGGAGLTAREAALVPDQAGQLPPGEVNALPHLLAGPGPHLTLVAGQAAARTPGVAAV